VRALRPADPHRDGQRSQVPRCGGGSRASGPRSYGRPAQVGGSQHHRRFLTQVGILLVRRTREGIPARGQWGTGIVHDDGPGSVRHADHTGGALWVSAVWRARRTALTISRPMGRREGLRGCVCTWGQPLTKQGFSRQTRVISGRYAPPATFGVHCAPNNKRTPPARRFDI
jgi:hypothetical protein